MKINNKKWFAYWFNVNRKRITWMVLVKETGLSKGTLSKLSTGKANPTLETIEKLVKIFKTEFFITFK